MTHTGHPGRGPRALVVVGDVATDVVAWRQAPLTTGTDTPARIRVLPGGAGANVSGALAAAGIDAVTKLPAGYLSAGQRRRLSIARLVAVKRPIWLLDEPTSALDRAAQDRLAGLMRGHLAGGGIIVAAAHGPIGLEQAMELRLGSDAR